MARESRRPVHGTGCVGGEFRARLAIGQLGQSFSDHRFHIAPARKVPLLVHNPVVLRRALTLVEFLQHGDPLLPAPHPHPARSTPWLTASLSGWPSVHTRVFHHDGVRSGPALTCVQAVTSQLALRRREFRRSSRADSAFERESQGAFSGARAKPGLSEIRAISTPSRCASRCSKSRPGRRSWTRQGSPEPGLMRSVDCQGPTRRGHAAGHGSAAALSDSTPASPAGPSCQGRLCQSACTAHSSFRTHNIPHGQGSFRSRT